MTLTTAHRILIASAIALFVFYAGWEVNNYRSGADALALLRAAASAGAAIGFGIYYRTIK